MNVRTKTLFHFTSSLDILQRILEEGFWPKYVLEDIAWLDSGIPRLAWPMVSFCDIPISRLHEHTGFYGDCGIGLCRRQWKAYGLNPLLYVSQESMLRNLLRDLLLDVRNNPNPRIKTAAMVVLAHCKPLEGVAEINGEKKTKDFYSECEWRYLPWVEGVGGENKYGFSLSEEQFRNEQTLKEANEERRKQMPTIEPNDVRYLLVKTREDVHKLIGFIDTKMANYSTIGRDMLKTRIMVLDDVSCDI